MGAAGTGGGMWDDGTGGGMGAAGTGGWDVDVSGGAEGPATDVVGSVEEVRGGLEKTGGGGGTWVVVEGEIEMVASDMW